MSLLVAFILAFISTTNSNSTPEVFYDDTFVMNRFHIIYQNPPVFSTDTSWTAERVVIPEYGSVNGRSLLTYLQVLPTQTTARVIFRRNGWTIRGDEQAAGDTINFTTGLVSGSDLVYSWLTIGLVQGQNIFIPKPSVGPEIYLRQTPWIYTTKSTGEIQFSEFTCLNNPGALLQFGPGTQIIKFGVFHEVNTGMNAGRGLYTKFDTLEFTITSAE